jgi:hypothetical protein
MLAWVKLSGVLLESASYSFKKFYNIGVSSIKTIIRRTQETRHSRLLSESVYPGNTNWRGRHRTVDPLIEVAGFVKY